MTPGRRYVIGLTAAAAVGLLIAGTTDPASRTEVSWGIALGILLQAPLGWLTVRSVGTGRFQVIWVLGMLIRLAMIALVGLVLVPALHWQMVPAMAGFVGAILALLLVEVLAVLRENSGIKGR